MSSVKIVTDRVREEAHKWRRLSGDMRDLCRNPLESGLELGLTSFFIGPTELVPAAMHYEAYVNFVNHFRTLALGAAVEWEQIREALTWIADEFDRVDAVAMESIEAAWTERSTSDDATLAANPDASASDGRPTHEPQ